MPDLASIAPLFPEITLAILALLLLMIGVFAGDSSARSVLRLATVSLVGCAVIVLLMHLFSGQSGVYYSAGNFLSSSLYDVSLKVVVLLAAALALLMSSGYIQREEMARPEFAVLVMLAVLGMMLMISASNFLMLYVGLELMSLSLYVLAAFRRDATRATEAGLKYFILGALASCLLLFGISLLYGITGSLDYGQIATALSAKSDAAGSLIAMVFVLVALAFKVSAAPFHMWVPDVYEGAPTPVTAFFAAVPKLAAAALLVKILYVPFHGLQEHWQLVLALLAAASLLVGAFGALGQNNLKRLFAYSSIGHVGFALAALAANRPEFALTYLLFYIVMSLGAFALLLLMKRDERMLEDVEDIAGLSRIHHGYAAALTVLMLSMAGIPPLVGFFTKLAVLAALVQGPLLWLAVLAVLASVVAAYYYLRLIKIMYFDEPVLAYDRSSEVVLKSTLGFAAVACVGGVLAMTPLLTLAQAATQALINN